MKDILSEIIANKRFEVDLQKQAISIEQLQEGISESPTPRSMKQALASSASGIIAEFKRRSPSKGWIQEEACPEEIVPSYAAAGASALSILTDEKFFGGSLKDIRAARPLVEIPILRKDFIIDEYQLYQAKIVGADAVLLKIGSALLYHRGSGKPRHAAHERAYSGIVAAYAVKLRACPVVLRGGADVSVVVRGRNLPGSAVEREAAGLVGDLQLQHILLLAAVYNNFFVGSGRS